MSGPAASAPELDQLAEGLRRAHERAAGLPAEERREVLRLWLAHRLGGRNGDEVRRSLAALTALLGGAPVAEAGPPPEPVEPRRVAASPEPTRPQVASRDGEVLNRFLQAYWGDAQAAAIPGADRADRASAALEELTGRLWDLAGSDGPDAPLSEALDRIAGRLAGIDAALRAAAKESFDRLFEAFSPTAIEAQVGRKGMRLGPFLKSGAYEAWVEKFGQLEAYHRAGRLVADFRALFQRHVKADREEKVAS
ncbi:MAG: hypothetical protein HZB55_13660 [Deltaproteobacteria bacterium]|nr:hypothetical protein [Deltaproteobacteria bacterium]